MTGLVFGHSGQVARELQKIAPEMTFLGREQADLADVNACAAIIDKMQPSFVINAAAYTAVDAAESDHEIALEVNGNAPGAMARACAKLGCPFVHISTDYVFNGGGYKPWTSEDTIDPVNYYGASKAEGEAQVVAAKGEFAILRTSWVFSAHGSNFVKSMLRLSQTRDALNIVDDQFGGPTPASGIASACLSIAHQLQNDPSKTGIYHYSGTPDISWAEFAEVIFELADKSVNVSGIPSSDYPTAAKRPLNSRMDCSSTKEVFGIDRPDWRAALVEVLTELETDHAA